MFTRLLTTWDSVRSSLWGLPLLMVVAAGIVAYAALGANIGQGNDPVWYLYSGNAKETPQFLSNLVSAMITMATLAISITMVVLALAAQQLGPRLIRSFMSDRRTQISLGLFASTVVYLLLVLRSAYGRNEAVANLAVTIGTALVLISVATLLFFVHHLARSIIADNVIDRVGAQLDSNIERLLPQETADQPAPPPKTKIQGAPVMLAYGGYVQAIDVAAIVQAAAEADAFVEVVIRPGQHAVAGSILGYVSPKAAGEKLTPAIQNAVLVGRERTAVQDLEFSVHQLVEIALRALSPGINDPYTAIAALNRLTLSLNKVMHRGEAKSIWLDDDGKTRVITSVSTFEGLADAAYNQIRQMASGSPAVLIRMAENIGQLLQQADKEHRSPLQKHLALVLRAGRRSVNDEDDLKDLEKTAQASKEDIGKADA